MSRAKCLCVAALAGAILVSTAAPVEAGWVVPSLLPARAAPSGPPDQSWQLDVPEKPGRHSKGKVAVFIFEGDDVYQPVRAAVVRALRRKGLTVTATLRPVDSAAQYREMSYALNLAVFVEGELRGEGARQSAFIRLRSGVSGQRMSSARFSGLTPKIVAEVDRKLWTRLGPAVMRACSSASRPRRRERAPTHIDASTPLEDS
jgi:hypothetical protein